MRQAVIDTNVWVSALLNPAGPPARVLAALEAGKFSLIASELLLTELREVLARPRLARKYHSTSAIANEFTSRLRRRATVVPVTSSLQLCRDPDDDMVIATAALGQANVLVTRDDDIKDDSDLVRILRAAEIEVLSVRQFLVELDFVVNYDQIRDLISPSGDVSINPRHFTREQSYEGIKSARVIADQSGNNQPVLWLEIELNELNGEDIFSDQLWLPSESGKLADFLEDLNALGISIRTPHDFVGLEFAWEYGHGYGTDKGGHPRLP